MFLFILQCQEFFVVAFISIPLVWVCVSWQLLFHSWVHRCRSYADSCSYFKMNIVKIGDDVWNAAAVIDCPATRTGINRITAIMQAFYNYGQRPRLGWKVNCFRMLYDIWIFQKGWRLKAWRDCELCPVTRNTLVWPRLKIGYNRQTYLLVKCYPLNCKQGGWKIIM